MIIDSYRYPSTPAEQPFTTTWKTDNAGSSTSVQVRIPTNSLETYNCVVDWGDTNSSTITTYNDLNWTHTYASAGTYQINITGVFGGMAFANGGDRLKLLSVSNWGSVVWPTMNGAFYGCSNCQFTATDTLVLPADCTSAFRGCTAFNQPVTNFNTSGVTNFTSFMELCSTFNQSVTGFNTALATNMTAMFKNCYAFDQSVAGFNTAGVLYFDSMFSGCTVFNRPVSTFNTAFGTSFGSMFLNCTNFNQSLASFNTSNAQHLMNMLQQCTSFKQSLATFSLSSLAYTFGLSNFAQGCDINETGTTTNYDATLIAWAAQVPIPFADSVNFGTSKYSSAAATARADLVADGVIVTDGGLVDNGLLTNLVSYWSLDEASGNRADSHTSGYTLTDTNTVTSAAGKISNGAQFASASLERLVSTDTNLLLSGATSLSLSAWVKRSGTVANAAGIINTMSGGNSGYGFLIVTDQKVRMYIYSGSFLYAQADVGLVDNTLTHVVGTWDGTTVRLYVNTVLQTITAAAPSFVSGTNSLNFGMYEGIHWNGLIDEVGIWNRALTPIEVTALYNSGAGLAYSSFAA